MTDTILAESLPYGSASIAAGTPGNTLTQTLTLASGVSCLIAMVGWSDTAVGADTLQVTWNGKAMLLLGKASSGDTATDRSLAVYYLNDPDDGTHDLVSVLTADVRHTLLWTAKVGTHLTAPFGTPTTASGTGNSASVPTGSVFPFMSFIGTRTTDAAGNVAGAGMTRKINVLAGTNQWWSIAESASGANASWTWSGTADKYAILGAALIPAPLPAGVNVKIKRGGVFVDAPLRIWRNGGWRTPAQVVVLRNAPPVTSTPYLPFNQTERLDTDQTIFSHYFTAFPFQPNSNTSDYWAINYLPADKVESASANYTGSTTSSVATGATVINVGATLAGNSAVNDRVVFETGVTGVYQVTAKGSTTITVTPAIEGSCGSGVAVTVTRGGTDHRVYGSACRDRSIQGRGSTLATGWQKIDMLQEIKDAAAAGCDGFWIDMLNITSTNAHWKNLNYLFDAADQYLAETGKHFWLAPMPDGTASAAGSVTSGSVVLSNASADALADAIYTFYGRANFWKVGGRYQIPVFGPEKLRANYSHDDTRFNFWTRVKTRLAGKSPSMPIDYIMCYVDTWTTDPSGANPTVGTNTAPTFNSLARVHGRWGDRDSTANASTSFTVGGAKALCQSRYGKPWQHWASPMDTRPPTAGTSVTRGVYRSWESKGFLALRNSWLTCINNAVDYVQIPTWNDYGENAHICPSRNNSFALSDLNAYYAEWKKRGSPPDIVRDCLYLAHRIHPHSQQTSSFPNTKQVKWAQLNGSTAWVNIVDVTCFLTAASTVEFLVNGVVQQTVSAVKGYNRFEFPLPASGIVSARAKRSGAVVSGTTVTSNITLGATLVHDDYHYRSFSSLRQA